MTTLQQHLMPLPGPWTPDTDQKMGVKFLLEHACAALLADPGVGKTSMALAAFKILKAKGMVSKMLIVAPLRPVYLTWPAELAKWTDFHGLSYAILHGPDKEKALVADVDIHIINPEGLDWLLKAVKEKTPAGKTRVKVDRGRFKKFGYDLLVVDELSKFKSHTSQRFKMVSQVVSLFGRRWGLTGSPAANGLMGLFSQCYVLDEGRTLGPYITHYRNQYFDKSYDGFTYTLREGSEDKIFQRIKPLALRIEAKGLPEPVYNDIWVDLPPKARKVYDELEKDFFALLDGHELVAANAAVASGKCRQVASGGLYLQQNTADLVKEVSSDREHVNIHYEKIEALADLIDELQGQPILVAYEFQHDLDRLREKFGKNIPYIGGGVSAKRAAELEGAWNRGELPVLFGHPQSIGHGLNLQQAGHHVAWLTLTWDYELYDQFIRRVWRRGQSAKRVFIHHFMARNTIDLAVRLALQSKQKGQQTLFDALKVYRKAAKGGGQ